MECEIGPDPDDTATVTTTASGQLALTEDIENDAIEVVTAVMTGQIQSDDIVVESAAQTVAPSVPVTEDQLPEPATPDTPQETSGEIFADLQQAADAAQLAAETTTETISQPVELVATNLALLTTGKQASTDIDHEKLSP